MSIAGDLLMSGIAFVGCALGATTPVPPPTKATRRREVVVAGKRVKTIDISVSGGEPLWSTRSFPPVASATVAALEAFIRAQALDPGHYVRVRDRFNRGGDPAALLYLLARLPGLEIRF